MTNKEAVGAVLDKMILSASGWRGIFAKNGDEESPIEQISAAHRVISGAAALVFAQFLTSNNQPPTILLGSDTRPTGRAIVDAVIPVLVSCGCNVRYAGVIAAPEIMAWAKSFGTAADPVTGFIYISASHNPIGHNGFKFGLSDGGVLPADEALKLTEKFRVFMEGDNCCEKIESLAASPEQIEKVYAGMEAAKNEAYKAYLNFCNDVIWDGSSDITAALDQKKHPLGIVCDFNGSARTVSVDKELFNSLGFKFESINSKPGEIAHRIVPEGESLIPCCKLLDEVRKYDEAFVLGYVPDCDGDRGNLVICDDQGSREQGSRDPWSKEPGSMEPGSRALEAQEVFALACVAELSHLVWANRGKTPDKVAVAINDPTSMRIDRIAQFFGVSVFRAEVGEANVVSLARKLREDSYIVRILGEGSAGGNITHPSAVRDPINTVFAILKLLTVRSGLSAGLFKIWCDLSGQSSKYHDDFTISDIINSLPGFMTTPAYNKDAVMRINTLDHSLLKDRYQQIFLRDWDRKKEYLMTHFNIFEWEALAFNGITETRCLKNFGKAGKGGLKILFKDNKSREIAYIWMRGSATEPVFRIMADISLSDINDTNAHQFLLDWQRCMIMEADG